MVNFSNFDYFPLKLHELVIGIETIFSALCILDRGEGSYKNYVDQIFEFWTSYTILLLTYITSLKPPFCFWSMK